MSVRTLLGKLSAILTNSDPVGHSSRARRIRHIRIEPLEIRCLLTISMDFMRQELAPHLSTIKYVTVVTHGFELSNAGGDALYPLAESILDLTDRLNGSSKTSWLLDYSISGEGGTSGFDNDGSSGSSRPKASGTLEHVVLLFDWAPESNEQSSGWAEAAGDGLFSTLIGLGLVNPAGGNRNPALHLIGHSRGAVVNSEAVQRLSHYQVPVAHVTYLDPHDHDQQGVRSA